MKVRADYYYEEELKMFVTDEAKRENRSANNMLEEIIKFYRENINNKKETTEDN